MNEIRLFSLTIGLCCALSIARAESPPPECGNGLIERGENCTTCKQDCTPRACTPSSTNYRVALGLATHEAWQPTAVTLHLSYRTDRLSIPGAGTDADVKSRVDFGNSESGITAINDLDHSIRIVRAEGKPLPRPLVTVELNACEGAPAPTLEDFSCVVEGCAGVGGAIEDGCTCEMKLAVAPAAAAQQ